MSILSDILGNDDLLSMVSSKLGTDKNKAAEIVGNLGQEMLGTVKNKIASPDVDSSKLESMISGGSFKSVLGNITGMFGGGDDESAGIEALSEITGSKEGSRELAGRVAEKTGFDISSIKQLLPSIAPTLLGFLGQKSAEEGGSGGILSMLDQDNDGDTDLNDLMGFVKKIF